MINLTERCFRYNLVVLTLLCQRHVLIVSLVAPWLFNWWAYQYRWAKVGTYCFRSQRVTLQTAAPPEAVLCMCGECPSASANAPVALTFNTWLPRELVRWIILSGMYCALVVYYGAGEWAAMCCLTIYLSITIQTNTGHSSHNINMTGTTEKSDF